MAPLGLLGTHNRRNALIARACLAALGVPQAADEDALRTRRRVRAPRYRLQPVGTVGGVMFVDDSLSTNVLPTLAAMDAFPGRRVALIAGGHDRGIDYGPLAAGLARDAPTLVLTLPDSGPRIQAAIEARSRGRREVDAGGRGGRWRSGPAPTSTRPSGPGSAGPGRTGSCCCPRPRRASGCSATTATGARHSPAR